MADREQVIKALRCSNLPAHKCDDDCPYRTFEPIKPEYKIPADLTIDGVDYWTGCDYDRIAADAVDLLERQDKFRWHDLRKDPNDLPNHHNMVYVYGYQSAACRNNDQPEYMMDHYVGGWMCGEIRIDPNERHQEQEPHRCSTRCTAVEGTASTSAVTEDSD